MDLESIRKRDSWWGQIEPETPPHDRRELLKLVNELQAVVEQCNAAHDLIREWRDDANANPELPGSSAILLCAQELEIALTSASAISPVWITRGNGEHEEAYCNPSTRALP